jgi:hypothetical protein
MSKEDSRPGGLRALVAAACACALLLAGASSAKASLAASESLTYLPYGFVHNEHPVAVLDETLGELGSFGIGQAILPMPKVKKDGTFKLSKREQRMIALWIARARADGGDETIVADMQAKVKRASVNLEEAAVRGRIVAGAETLIAMGVGGIQLDFEPYPQSHGYVVLLRELRSAFARLGFSGRLSVCAPANRGTWSPAYMTEVTAQLDQVDPLFYDSEQPTAVAYERWMREGLAYYSANVAAGTGIVPVIPSYGPDRWHIPTVEDVADATVALEEGLAEGDRIDGAGVFWWWAFYLEEEGAYQPAADQAAWLSDTRALPFSAAQTPTRQEYALRR